MTYSLDFRKKVLSFREKEKLTIPAVASRFGVGIASVKRWLKSPEPKATRTKPATKVNDQALLEDVRLYPDSYQYERAVRLGVTQACICYALRRLQITYKKKSNSPEAGRRRKAAFPKKD